MGGLFRPKISRFTKDGKQCPKGTEGAERVITEGKVWWGTWVDPGSGKEQRQALHRSKTEAAKLLAEIEMANTRQRLGLAPKRSAAIDRPLAEQFAEYLADLRAEGDTEKHVQNVENQCQAVFQALQWTRITDICPDGVQNALATMRKDRKLPEIPEGKAELTTLEAANLLDTTPKSVRRLLRRAGIPALRKVGTHSLYPAPEVLALLHKRCQGLSIETTNHYLKSLKAFAAWLHKRKRLFENPLLGLESGNADVDRRRVRRALEVDLWGSFVDLVASGPVVDGLQGPARLLLYLTAGNTGFRAHELATLTPDAFSLAGDEPTVMAKARFGKNRKLILQPLRPDLAKLLAPYVASRPAAMPIWPGNWYKRAATMLRADLERAGIPYQVDGQVFDFHGLRLQFGKLLAAAHVHPKVAQELLRLSSVDLAMKHYNRASGRDLRAALDLLPALPGREAEGVP